MGPVVRAGLWLHGLSVWVGVARTVPWPNLSRSSSGPTLQASAQTPQHPAPPPLTLSGNTASLWLSLAPVLMPGSHSHKGCQSTCLALLCNTEQAVSGNSVARFRVPGMLAVPASDSVYHGTGDTVCRQHSSRLAQLLNPKTKHLPP